MNSLFKDPENMERLEQIIDDESSKMKIENIPIKSLTPLERNRFENLIMLGSIASEAIKEYNQIHTPKPIPRRDGGRGMVQTVRWIPANEAVPDDARDVIAVAYGDTSNIHLIGTLETAFYENRKWYSANIVDDDRANMLQLNVTAWMEIPNIPEQYDELSDTEAANGQ